MPFSVDLTSGWIPVAAIPRPAIVTDLDGVVVAWNAAATELYGWSADEAIGRPILELLSIERQVASDATDLRSVAAGASHSGDRWVRRRDGTEILVRTATQLIHDDGRPVAIIGLSEDVTEERRRETRAQDLMTQLRTALDAGEFGTWQWDTRTDRVAWDEKLEQLFGLSPGAFDGRFETYVGLLHPDDRAAVLSTVEAALAERRRYRVEHRVIHPDGAVRWIRGAATVLVDDDGNVTGTAGCAADVTDEIEAAAELQRLHEISVDTAERERVQRQRLEFIARVNDALRDSASVDDVMARVTRALVPDLGTWCSLYVLDNRGGEVPTVQTWHADPAMVRYARELQARFPYDPEAPQGIPAVIRDGRSEFVPVIDHRMLDALELTDELRDIVNELGLSSSIAVPLIKGRRVLGALSLVTAHGSRRYTDDDVALAEALASRIATTIDNVQLREQARTTSTILQRSLLPAHLPTLPGVDLGLRYWPAGEGMVVGGDFYDVFPAGTPGRWAIVIGDVCGTGPEAAALTGLARHTLRDAVWHGDAPSEVLRSVDRALHRSGSGTFLTAIYGELDVAHDSPRLTIAIGGHPLPLLIRAGQVTPIGEHGTLLGLVEDPRLQATDHQLLPGDVLVLYTDGATDMRPPLSIAPDQFEQLVASCARDAGHSAAKMADLLGEAFDAIQPFDQRNDDVAAMVLCVGADPLVEHH